MNHSPTRHALAAITTLASIAALSLTACSADSSSPSAQSTEGSLAASETTTHQPERTPQEAAGPSPRLVATYDGGLLTLDAATLRVIDDTKLDGFNRLNPVGDGRTVLVSTQDGFRAHDTGTWTQPHGDHSHSYTMPPQLTETTYAAAKPGHVVNHGGRTLLFGDGDGSIQELRIGDLNRAYQHKKLAKAQEIATITPHHGVAVPLSDDGGMLRTEGTEDERHSVVAVDAKNKEIARADNCPGVHGEATAANGVITVGCEDGVLIYRPSDNGSSFTKVTSPDSFGRIGNQAGSPVSPVVLGDYKTQKEPKEREQPTRISLTNTQTGELQLVDLGASYSFRSLARGPHGEALVLTDAGTLKKIDPATGSITGTYPVVKPWVEPLKWQEARPTLFVQGATAYVTEPAANKIHAVDIATGKVTATATTPAQLNELTGVSG